MSTLVELEQEKDAPVETQQTRGVVVDGQTRMTSFEMNLKDKR